MFLLCTVLEISPNFPIYVQYDQKIISYYMKNLKYVKKKSVVAFIYTVQSKKYGL